jgi:cytidylate kinase
VAPLVPAEGAHILDTSEMTVEDAVAKVLGWWAHG